MGRKDGRFARPRSRWVAQVSAVPAAAAAVSAIQRPVDGRGRCRRRWVVPASPRRQRDSAEEVAAESRIACRRRQRPLPFSVVTGSASTGPDDDRRCLRRRPVLVPRPLTQTKPRSPRPRMPRSPGVFGGTQSPLTPPVLRSTPPAVRRLLYFYYSLGLPASSPGESGRSPTSHKVRRRPGDPRPLATCKSSQIHVAEGAVHLAREFPCQVL